MFFHRDPLCKTALQKTLTSKLNSTKRWAHTRQHNHRLEKQMTFSFHLQKRKKNSVKNKLLEKPTGKWTLTSWLTLSHAGLKTLQMAENVKNNCFACGRKWVGVSQRFGICDGHIFPNTLAQLRCLFTLTNTADFWWRPFPPLGGDFNWQMQEQSHLTWWFGSLNDRLSITLELIFNTFCWRSAVMLDIGTEGNQQSIPYWGGGDREWKGFVFGLATWETQTCPITVWWFAVSQLNNWMKTNISLIYFFPIRFMGRKTFSNYFFCMFELGASHTGTTFESDKHTLT